MPAFIWTSIGGGGMAEKLLEQLKLWLSTYPEWDDFCLLPKSWEEISQNTDLVGNKLIEQRCYVNLYWQMPSLGDEAQNACRLLDFQNWVREQCVLSQIPRLGDVAALDRVLTEKGGFTMGSQMVAYTITLVVDFAKTYKV